MERSSFSTRNEHQDLFRILIQEKLKFHRCQIPCSDKDLHQSIREHGHDAFQVETLQEWENISDEALQTAETYFITEHNTFPNGDNMHVKGNSPNTPIPVETRTHVSERLHLVCRRFHCNTEDVHSEIDVRIWTERLLF